MVDVCVQLLLAVFFSWLAYRLATDPADEETV
jgi:hypothetical protein